jgi:hypothetical protein
MAHISFARLTKDRPNTAKAQWLAHFSFESELVRQHQGSLRRCSLKCGSTLIKAKQCKTNKEEIPMTVAITEKILSTSFHIA